MCNTDANSGLAEELERAFNLIRDADISGASSEGLAKVNRAWNIIGNILTALTPATTDYDALVKERDKWRRIATDRLYMLEAVVPMLGEKGQQVWALWQENRVQRVHFDWGPEGAKTTGEDRARLHLEIEEACQDGEPIEDVDRHISQTNFAEPWEAGDVED